MDGNGGQVQKFASTGSVPLKPPKKRQSIQFSEGEPSRAAGKSKVVPMSAADNQSDAPSVMSRTTVSAFHKALARGQEYEEHSLSLLRRLLLIVSVSIIGLSLATMSISKTVIAGGVASAIELCSGGDRSIAQQVHRGLPSSHA